MRRRIYLLLFLGVLTGCLMLSLLAFLAIRNDQGRNLKKYFGIEIPESNEFTASEIVLLQPAVEKRLSELLENYCDATEARLIMFQARDKLTVTDVDNALQNFRSLEKKVVETYYYLQEACEAAKYFKLVPEDCEPCKAVK